MEAGDLDAGGPGLILEQVSLLVRGLTPAPSPANVWIQPVGSTDLQVNPFTATYQGQQAGDVVVAAYSGPIREGHVQLRPGEHDDVTITIQSTVVARLSFDVRVVYRLAAEQQLRVLTLGGPFDVAFVDSRGWRPYYLAGSQFLPA